MPSKESGLIRLFYHLDKGPGVTLGIGDDCAIITPDTQPLLITTDTMVEGIHFDTKWHRHHELGRKIGAVNLSDIAAMGGIPRYALLSITVHPTVQTEHLEKLATGFKEILAEHQVALIGGDSTTSPGPMVLSATLMGTMPRHPTVTPMVRSGAQPGDQLWVSGHLGDARAALGHYLKQKEKDAPQSTDPALQTASLHTHQAPQAPRPPLPPSLHRALCDPTPRIKLGQELARSGLVHGCMDLSDGLLIDLQRLITATNPTNRAAIDGMINVEDLPISPDCRAYLNHHPHGTIQNAILGGEDYQLLVAAVPGEKSEQLLGKELKMTRIGQIVPGRGETHYQWSDGTPFRITGKPFTHF